MNKMYNPIDNCFMHNTDSQVKAASRLINGRIKHVGEYWA